MARQGSKPSEFMPWVQGLVQTALGASPYSTDPAYVKLVAEDTDKEPEMMSNQFQINLWLSRPQSPNINAGAGRRGFIVNRIIGVTIYTRAGRDRLGDDSAALGQHWDLEDKIVDALLIKVPDLVTPTPGVKFFIEQMRLVDNPGVERLYRLDGSKYKSTLTFQVAYLLPTTEALT